MSVEVFRAPPDGRIRQRVFHCRVCELDKVEQSGNHGRTWALVCTCGCSPAPRRLAGARPRAKRTTTLF